MEKQINDAQKRAILHDAGPMLVLAGPGSGKTFVITNRIKHLTHELGISGDQILVISFSRASALEMKDRYLQLTGDLSTPVSFGTFHAVFFQILKNEYHLSTSDLLSFKEKRDILRESLQQAMYDCKSDDDLLLGLMEWKDKLEHTEDDPEDALSILLELFGKEKNLGGCLAGEELPVSPKIYETLRDHYEDIVRKRKKLDFDDMLVRCRDLFRARPGVLRKYQAQYRYILIDEFQDINPIQFEVIRMLAKPENNLFVVGDDDQAIYSFRGSSPEIMLHFKEYYPLAKQVILNVNYRCAGNILEVAAALIRENKNRFAKDPEAFREAGERVELIHTKERSEEYEILIRSIKEQMKQGISITDMAILYRKSADMEGMLRALDQAEIPYRKRELVKCLHQSFIAEDIRSYVRYITGDHSRQVFLKIMNKPFRYLYRDHLKAASYAPDNTLLRKFIIHDSKEQKRNMALEKLVRDVAVLKRMPPYLFCNYLRKGLGYDKYLADLSAMGQDKTQTQIKEKLREYKAELDQLMETMKDFRTLEEWLSFSQEEKDKAGEQKQVMVEQEGIRLITYHSSKGLEFEVVFLPDLNEGVVPHSKAIRPESLEEERRMLYVAMTRAKKKLYLLYADTAVVGTGDKGHRLLPSRFLSGLDQSSSSKSILSRYSSNASAAASYSASSSI